MTDRDWTSITSRRFALWTVLLALVVGIVGTAAIMAWVLHRRSAPSPSGVRAGSDEHAAGATGASKGSSAEAGPIRLSAEAKETAGIHVEPVRMAAMGDSLTVPGTVEVSPRGEAKVTPPVAGKVAALLVNLGDTVRAGQPLAMLDSYEVAQAHAAARQAESSVDQARAALQTTQAEVSQARAGAAQSEAEVQAARTKVASAGTALQRQRDLAAAGAFAQAPLQTAQSELAESQSALLRAQSDLQAQTAALRRAERLFEAEIVSRGELERTQSDYHKDQADVERAQSRVTIAKQALEREQKVFRGDLLTKQAVQTAEAEVRAAQAEVLTSLRGVARAQQDVRKAQKEEQAAQTALRGAQAGLAAARANLNALAGSGSRGSLLTLVAPIGGTIAERRVTLGEVVERSSLLFVIENLNTVLVQASVPERNVGAIRLGQQVMVTVAAYPDERYAGVVQSMAGSVDEKTRALPVRCLVENRGGRLRPEMFARVSLAVGGRAVALAVPAAAVDEDGGDTFVYVEESGGYERRKVQIGRRSGAMAQVTSGLKPGDRIAVSGIFVLKSESKKDELKGDED